jgi:uncharacterized membrane protein YfhO
MNPLRIIRLRVILLTAGLLSFFMIMLYLTPYKTFLFGLILGLLLSCYNVLHTAKKLYGIGETVSRGERWTRGTGMVTRFLVVALVLYIASRYPHIFDVKAVLFGLPLGYILSVCAYFQVREQMKCSKGVNAKNGVNTKD